MLLLVLLLLLLLFITGSLSGNAGIGHSTGGAPPGTMAANIHHAKDLLQETG